jgi:translation initiation factor IF-2
MAKVRAYKIAEELGIDRNELVDKARELGIELKSAMASLDDEQADTLREKLGAKRRGAVTEARVERKGTAVIRRRKRRAPEPAPEPEVAEPEAAEPVAETGAPAEGAEPEAQPPVEGEPAVEPSVEPETVQPGAAEAPQPGEGPEPAAPAAPTRPEPKPARPAAAPAARGRAGAADEAAAGRRGPRKQFKEVVNLREQEQLARQVTSRTTGRPSPPQVDPRAFTPPRRRRRDAPPQKAAQAKTQPPKAEKRVVRVEGEISVAELAKQLGAKAAQIQGKLMGLGTMVAVNQTVSVDTARQVAEDFGYEVQDVGFQEEEFLEVPQEEASEADLRPRPPVVTVMGHVDHGKTSLLDALRETKVVEGEAGGITQHIGAYQVEKGGQRITFIDTPGHAAFTSMRARGAQATDIVILVVAASEGIMPQTIEAIDHAKAAGVPMVVAINKCDLPDANPQLTRQRLTEHGVIVEEFGGDVLAVEISALKRTGLDKLLEAVLLQAELVEPKADPNRRAKGVVLESQLEKGRGPVATVLVQEGTLHRGDVVVAGRHHGRVRSMSNELGETVKEAPPSAPVQVVGLSGVPDAGQAVHVVESEKVAKEIVAHREDQMRGQAAAPARPRVSLEELFAQHEGEGPKELNVILKADTQGSAEALREALLKIESDKVDLKVLHASVGGVTENDVQLAEASQAIIVGFHVRPDAAARRAAEQAGVDVRIYKVIYEALDEVRAAMAGLLPPTVKEVVIGQAEVRQTFSIPRVGTIAGCMVTDGLMRRNAGCRVVRDGVQVWEGRFASLKRFKDDVREVQSGFECGIGIEGFNDLKPGDVIEAFEHEEQPAEL